MTTTILIKEALLVNEGQTQTADVLIKNGRIEQIGQQITANQAQVIEAGGLYLLPGICLLYTSPSPRDLSTSRMPSSA